MMSLVDVIQLSIPYESHCLNRKIHKTINLINNQTNQLVNFTNLYVNVQTVYYEQN